MNFPKVFKANGNLFKLIQNKYMMFYKAPDNQILIVGERDLDCRIFSPDTDYNRRWIPMADFQEVKDFCYNWNTKNKRFYMLVISVTNTKSEKTNEATVGRYHNLREAQQAFFQGRYEERNEWVKGDNAVVNSAKIKLGGRNIWESGAGLTDQQFYLETEKALAS